jgi:hypothetical protein
MLPRFKRQGFWGRLADLLALPLMYILQGNFREVPQRTHFWNNVKFKDDSIEVGYLMPHIWLLEFRGITRTSPRYLFGLFPVFHIPILGGWKTFKVLRPKSCGGEYFIGWWSPAEQLFGVSKVTQTGSVRVLIGPDDVFFFAVDIMQNYLELVEVGQGEIGSAGKFAKVPLL